MRPDVVVHHLDQAMAVIRAAKEAGVDVRLRSAPGAAASAGVGYLKALGEAVGQTILVDCEDDSGLVMAALRANCQCLDYSGPTEEWRRLNQLARRYGAALSRPKDDQRSCRLSLLPDDGYPVICELLYNRSRSQ